MDRLTPAVMVEDAMTTVREIGRHRSESKDSFRKRGEDGVGEYWCRSLGDDPLALDVV